MTAPDSRDSVERVVAEMRIPHEGGWDNDDVDALADRLQALARGPQQAGGEDAKDAARYRWIRQHFKATFHRSTSDYWLIQGEHKTPAAVFRDGMDLTLDAAIDAALSGGQDDA